MSLVLSSPTPNASATVNGSVADGAQTFPPGPKTVQDLLKLAGNWSHTVDPGDGAIIVSGLPLELGDLGSATFADLVSVPGLRRYTVTTPDSPEVIVEQSLLLGTATLGVEISELNNRITIHGTIQTVNTNYVTATSADFGGVNALGPTGLTITGAGSIVAPSGTIETLAVTNLTIGGDPYVRRIIDTIDTTTGLGVVLGELYLSGANGSTPGAMTTAAQNFLGAKTFSDLLTASSGISTATVSSASALTMISALGTGASDVCMKVGTSVADGSVNSSAKLWGAYTGLGATEVLKLWVDKNGDIRSTSVGVGRFRGSSASLGYVSVDDTSGTRLVYGNQTVSIGSHIQFSSDGNFLSAYVGSGTMQSAATDGASAVGLIINTSTSWVNATAKLLSVRTGGSERLSVNASGRFDQSGSDSSLTPGNATINKPIGKSAIASGADTVRITNSLVAAGDQVQLTWHGDHGRTRSWVTTAAGYFDVFLDDVAAGNAAFCWEIKKRI